MTISTIALLTDFGLSDHYVGVMKAVILDIHPEVRLLDITHHISPGDLLHGAYTLLVSYPYFPVGTIFLTVVDPGVGSKRQALLVQTEKYTFIGPDNGVLSFALEKEKIRTVVSLENHRYFLYPPSQTFHGRDIFAPVAAYVSKGVKPLRFGSECVLEHQMTFPEPAIEGTSIVGMILCQDHFGNLITNISRDFVYRFLLEQNRVHQDKLKYIKNEEPNLVDFKKVASYTISAGGVVIQGLANTYEEVPLLGLLAIFGSSNFLEISMNGGNAASLVNIRQGDMVSLTVEKV